MLHLGLPDGRYFTANLAEAGILKISAWSWYFENKVVCRKRTRRYSQIVMTPVVNLVRAVPSANFVCCC